MGTLAEALDAFIEGDPTRDLLIQRSKLCTSGIDANWSVARHLDVIPGESVTFAG